MISVMDDKYDKAIAFKDHAFSLCKLSSVNVTSTPLISILSTRYLYEELSYTCSININCNERSSRYTQHRQCN